MPQKPSQREEKSKMSREVRYAVWKPSVEWIDPREFQLGLESKKSASAHSPCHTKTSLRLGAPSDRVYELNKLIRGTSDSHNATTRPFVRQTSLISSPLYQEPVLFKGEQNLSWGEQEDILSRHIDQRSIDDRMSQKLVHNQYNSPIGMYSTEAIHKAIEAQSEEIAPGVKGFRPAKSPINMQSEVLKMVREEEQERQLARAASSSSQSKCSQAQMSLESNQQSVTSTNQNHSQSCPVQQAIQSNQSPINSTGAGHIGRATLEAAIGNKRSPNLTSGGRSTSPVGQPKCCECGSSIIGQFARVEKRFVHPHCFNCSTCGTSLKNSGYFSINEKLYCDIHARQVAEVMRLNHNFQPDRQPIERAVSLQEKTIAQEVDRQAQLPTTAASARSMFKQQQQHQQSIAIEHCSSCCNRSTTISSIFSRRGCSNCHGRPCSQIKIYQPVEVHKSKELIRNITSPNGDSSSLNQSCHQCENSYKLPADQFIARPTNSLLARTPICCNCHKQIQGPYILAGKAVWCKPCSENKFICCTCHKSLLDYGFIEDSQVKGKYHCEGCFETHLMPVCAKCNRRITEHECLKALGKTWHTGCFVCARCKCSFGNSKFYLEDNLPYCEPDWNLLFTTKCDICSYPIEAGDKWIEALGRNYHSDCFRCTGCQVKLEGSTFVCRNGKPYCRMHAS